MITVHIALDYDGIDISCPRMEALVQGICSQFDIAEAMVSIAVLDDASICHCNKEFLDREGTTDCFSFDLSDDQAENGQRVFEVIVNGEKARQEAARRGHACEAELALYITHGMLHHLGFDDQDPQSAYLMHAREDEILQQFGYGIVYNSGNPNA